MMSTFGDRITQLVNMFGRETITENTGISQSQLYRLKSGDQDTTRKNIVLIQKATGCNLQWLATGDGPMMPGDAEPLVNEPEFTNDEIEMIELYRASSLKKKSEILNQLMNND